MVIAFITFMALIAFTAFIAKGTFKGAFKGDVVIAFITFMALIAFIAFIAKGTFKGAFKGAFIALAFIGVFNACLAFLATRC